MNSQNLNIQSIVERYLVKAKNCGAIDCLGRSAVSDPKHAFLYGLDFCWGGKGVG